MAPTTPELVALYGEPDDIAADFDDYKGGATNLDRVDWALAALTPFHVATMGGAAPPGLDESWADTDAESAIGDLICDLLHLATYTGCDATTIWQRGWSHFEGEAGLGYES